jgi:Family of unknown function (DUF5771)
MRQPNNNNSKKKCPPGYSYRKAYTRKMHKKAYTVQRKGQLYDVSIKKNTVEIPASCVKNRESAIQDERAALRKGALIKYGYSFKLRDQDREIGLKKAIQAYGAKKVFTKLAIAAKVSKNSQPKASAIFARDAKWVHSNFKV